jgi:hypothetical protein
MTPRDEFLKRDVRRIAGGQSAIVRPGTPYSSTTAYRFSVVKGLPRHVYDRRSGAHLGVAVAHQ